MCLIGVNSNASKFSFEKKETEVVVSHGNSLSKMDRSPQNDKMRIEWFVNLKKKRQITEIRFRPFSAQLSEPLSADKNQWFQNVNWPLLTNMCHIDSLRKLNSVKFSLVSCCVGSLA